MWNEHKIAMLIANEFFQRKYLVMVPNCNWTGHECDVLAVTNDCRVVDIEIKISRSDLKADAKKEKWWHKKLVSWGCEQRELDENGRLIRIVKPPVYEETRLTHPPKVWKHYYCMPRDIWDDKLLESLPSKNSGILLLYKKTTRIGYEVKRKASPNKEANQLKPSEIINLARLASLRMWDSYVQVENARSDAGHYRQQVQAITGGLI